MGEETIRPLAGVGIHAAVQCVFGDGLKQNKTETFKTKTETTVHVECYTKEFARKSAFLSCVNEFFSGRCSHLGVNDVSDALDSLDALQRVEQHAPRHRLATATRPHHHETVVDLRYLVQLQHL